MTSQTNRTSHSRRAFCWRLGGLLTLPLWARGTPARAAAETLLRQRFPSSPETFRVVTANLRATHERDYATGDGWTQRRELCRDVLLAQRADLLGFQECRLAHLDYLLPYFPDYAAFGLANERPGRTEEPSNSILYSTRRFEHRGEGGFWFSEEPMVRSSRAWGTAAPRFINWLDLRDRVTGRALRFWNTHLDYHSRLAREHSSALIAAAAAALPDTLPQVLAGDFNARGTPRHQRRIVDEAGNVRTEPITNPPPRSRAIQNVIDGGWHDTHEDLHGAEEPGLTAHQFRGEEFAATEQGQARGKIDYIFRRGPLRTIAAEIIRDRRDGRYPSDHYFVSAELEYLPE